jgi:hypothetical protein
MRKLFLAVLILVAGCAGQPTSPPVVVEKVPAGAKEIAPPTEGTVDATRLAEAKKMGYKLVNQDGQELYCRNDLKTGSRVQHELVCLSRKDLDELRARTQQGLAENAREMHPAGGH